MKSTTIDSYEAEEVVCPVNSSHRLSVILEECYLEVGPAVRVVCKECHSEVFDFGLAGESKNWEWAIRKIQEDKKKGELR